VSPSWRDRLLIGLAPERVAAVHVKRGLRPALGGDVVGDCSAASDASAAPWVNALTALDGLLDSLPQVAGDASVVLSSQFVRYVRVPWTEGVLAEKDRQALAAGCFRAVYGEAVERWRIVVDAPRYGCDNLAAAVDEALVDGLREILARRRLRLTAVRPHLAAAFNRWQPRLEAGDGGFVLVEPGCVTSLFRRRGQWVEVANRRCRDPGEAAEIIRQCVDAERILGEEGSVVVLAPGTPLETKASATNGTNSNRQLRRLNGLGEPWPDDPWRSMAWSAA
jgi:hypothetical protein